MNDSTNSVFKFLKNKYLLIFGVSLVLLILLLVIFVFPSSDQKEKGAEEPATVYDVAPESIKVGVGNFSERSHIAEEAEKKSLSDGSIEYTFESQNPRRNDVMIVKDGSILLRRHVVMGEGVSDEYKGMLGRQDDILPGPTYYGPNTSIYFYSELGTALVVDPETSITYEVFTFSPITIEEFKLKYQQYTQ